jgi:hypothetical protein
MPRSRICSRRTIVAALTCLALGGALVAPAASTARSKPVKVTVEVLGKPPAEKVLLKRTVTLTRKPVVKDGGSCSGRSAAGALQRATKGAWGGTWSSAYSDYEVTKIEGIYLPFESKSAANWYWQFLVNGKEASAGVCATKPKNGEKLLFKPACYGKACPKPPKAKRSSFLATDGRRR